ncbi:unnamed protein product [Schistocephalus solidus]|uniref:C2H2-type domain-containing protein n=1 Tax=Schistocephalus solidus TaxID=70667 RepID=A0A183T3U8_SCHSO|nr:unnamed protein product [Schistocephalus solidus]
MRFELLAFECPPNCPRCQCTFRTRIGQKQCHNNQTPSTYISTKSPFVTPASNPTASTTTPTPTSDDLTADASSLSVPHTMLPTATPTSITSPNTTDTASTTLTSAHTTSNSDLIPHCPRCDRKFTERIGLVCHLRSYRTETG